MRTEMELELATLLGEDIRRIAAEVDWNDVSGAFLSPIQGAKVARLPYGW